MNDRPLIFVDTETTGLEPSADIWEFAAIRRDPSGAEASLHLFVEHDAERCARLPDPFLSDHSQRFPHLNPRTRRGAGADILSLIIGDELDDNMRPIWVGSAPDFDAPKVARLIRAYAGSSWREVWDHQLIGVVPLMLGYLAAKGESIPEHKSEQLSRAIGVDPDQFERHTAMGDVLWTMAIYDRVMGVAR